MTHNQMLYTLDGIIMHLTIGFFKGSWKMMHTKPNIARDTPNPQLNNLISAINISGARESIEPEICTHLILLFIRFSWD